MVIGIGKAAATDVLLKDNSASSRSWTMKAWPAFFGRPARRSGH